MRDNINNEIGEKIHHISQIALEKFDGFYPIMEEVNLLALEMSCCNLEKFVTYAIPGGMEVLADFERHQSEANQPENYTFIDYAYAVIRQAEAAMAKREPNIHCI